MSKLKILIAALILGLGGTGAYLIMSDSGSAKSPTPNNLSVSENNPVGIETNGAGITANLSEILAKKIAESLVKENSDGFITSKGKTMITAPEPEQMAADLIAEAQKSFDPNSLRTKISESSLKISEDSNKDAVLKYIDSVNKIATETFKKMPASMVGSEELKISDFTAVKNAYEYEVSALYGLTVPRIILNTHKTAIELLTAKKNIYEKMANAETDPLTAILAANEIQKIEQELTQLDIEMGNLLKTFPTQ